MNPTSRTLVSRALGVAGAAMTVTAVLAVAPAAHADVPPSEHIYSRSQTWTCTGLGVFEALYSPAGNQPHVKWLSPDGGRDGGVQVTIVWADTTLTLGGETFHFVTPKNPPARAGPAAARLFHLCGGRAGFLHGDRDRRRRRQGRVTVRPLAGSVHWQWIARNGHRRRVCLHRQGHRKRGSMPTGWIAVKAGQVTGGICSVGSSGWLRVRLLSRSRILAAGLAVYCLGSLTLNLVLHAGGSIPEEHVWLVPDRGPVRVRRAGRRRAPLAAAPTPRDSDPRRLRRRPGDEPRVGESSPGGAERRHVRRWRRAPQ